MRSYSQDKRVLSGDEASMCELSFWNFETLCLPVAIILGVVVGLLVPGNSDLSSQYRPVSSVIGWIYFFSWTISFYPQIYQNYVRKTTMGFASDKMVYDLLGFTCLSTYSLAFYAVPHVRSLYADRNHGNYPQVQINDVCFALHAVAATFVQIGQIWRYDGRKQMPTRQCLLTVAFVVLILLIYLAIVVAKNETHGVFSLLDWFYLVSFVKIGVTMVKYIPQVLLNFTRKSTVGWSITGSLMDLTGGTLSQLQLLLDCNDVGDWNGVTGDLVKLALGAVSVIFDLIFVTQHYILYPDSSRYHMLPASEQLLLDDDKNFARLFSADSSHSIA